jgi:RNA polymerase sigma-70 factor (ECF subfamily)
MQPAGKDESTLVTTATANEVELVSRAQQGDRGAFSELVRQHYPGVIRVVHRMCGDVQLAEDAAQEAFIRAWVNLANYDPRSPLRNWLYRIAVNAALDMLRRKTDDTLSDDDALMVADQAPGPEAAMIRNERIALLQRAVQSLPEAARSVLVLKEYGELSYQEIAGVLDIPIGTVMSRLNYARNRLRELLRGVTSL